MIKARILAAKDLPLTEHELIILAGMADGASQKSAAKTLHCSDRTVASVASLIRAKMRAKTMPQAVAEGFRRGLLK